MAVDAGRHCKATNGYSATTSYRLRLENKKFTMFSLIEC